MDLFKDEKIDTIEFLRLVYQKRWVIVTATLAAFALSILVTYFIPPKFYSYGTIFPPYSNSLEEVLERPDFGFDMQADRLMQILESKVMRDSIINEFNLIEYYKLDTTHLDWKFKLDKKYIRDINFSRSKYMSIVISAKMKSPELSANIVNRIIDIIDDLREQIFRENFQEQLSTVENDYTTQREWVDKLLDSLNTRIEQDETGNLNALFFKSNYNFNDPEKKQIQIPLKDEQLLSAYSLEKQRLNKLKEKLDYTKSIISKPFTKVYIVDRAKPSFKKISPSYRLNALIAVSATLVLTILVLVFNQKFQSIREQIITK